jgi:FlaA1/EpsC-like NDP-sugar epimerase
MMFKGRYRRLIIVLLDLVLCVVSFWLAFYIRFEGNIPHIHLPVFLKNLPLIVGIRFVCFWFFGLYRGIWRYASINDLVNLFKAIISSTILFILFVVFSHGLIGFPRSVFIIDALLTIILVGGSRFTLRIFREVQFKENIHTLKRALIIGAGDAGDAVLREVRNNPKLNYNVVGFIDDDKMKQKMNIQGVSVVGTKSDIARLVKKKKINEIIIAMPSATRQQMKSIVEECEKTNANLKTIPAIGDMINGTVSFSQIREVQIEDLLGRDVVEIDTESIRKYLSGKKVLVTGAGGSIGAEICRQIMKFDLKSLVLFGRGEHSIYNVYQELKGSGNKASLFQVIGDVINRKKIEGTFRKYKPEIVFHAGADKHVPLLESNPDEAVLNNVIGTKNLVEVSEEFKIERVVSVSTDKAADPVSVMGCTKRIAELIIQGRKHPVTKSIGVRFGNVLGSRGSVIPLFREQIKKGGPVTVTHSEMVRYFMTVPEAARLVLQAGAIGGGGEIFLLDMGNPIKIVDLARQMIRLSGFEPEVDIPVKFVGLRPGEKLEETLTGKDEKISRTIHPKILVIHFDGKKPDYKESDFEELKGLAIRMDTDGIIKKLEEMVSNYIPDDKNTKRQ